MALRLARTWACHPPRRSQGSDTDSRNGKGMFGGFVRDPPFFWNLFFLVSKSPLSYPGETAPFADIGDTVC